MHTYLDAPWNPMVLTFEETCIGLHCKTHHLSLEWRKGPSTEQVQHGPKPTSCLAHSEASLAIMTKHRAWERYDRHMHCFAEGLGCLIKLARFSKVQKYPNPHFSQALCILNIAGYQGWEQDNYGT